MPIPSILSSLAEKMEDTSWTDRWKGIATTYYRICNAWQGTKDINGYSLQLMKFSVIATFIASGLWLQKAREWDCPCAMVFLFKKPSPHRHSHIIKKVLWWWVSGVDEHWESQSQTCTQVTGTLVAQLWIMGSKDVWQHRRCVSSPFSGQHF